MGPLLAEGAHCTPWTSLRSGTGGLDRHRQPTVVKLVFHLRPAGAAVVLASQVLFE